MAKLKPCPFCGAVDPEEQEKDKRKKRLGLLKKPGPLGDVWLVICCGCGTSSNNYDTPKQAIRAWNRRTKNGTV